MIIPHFLEKGKVPMWDFLSVTQFRKQMTFHRIPCKSSKFLVLGAKDAGSCEVTCFLSVSNMEILVVTPVADAGQTVKLFLLPSFTAAFGK